MSWAELMKRAFAVDVLECPDCRGPMKIIATITESKVIRPFLAALHLATEVPKVARSRSPPQLELEWDGDRLEALPSWEHATHGAPPQFPHQWFLSGPTCRFGVMVRGVLSPRRRTSLEGAELTLVGRGRHLYDRGTMKRSLLGILLSAAAGAVLSLSCQPESEESCAAGSVGCECSAGQCFAGLSCVAGICMQSSPTTTATVDETTSETEATSASESETEADDADSSGSASADTTETGATGCQGTDGTIDCPCLAGNTCLGDLACDSNQTCVCLSGTACGQSDCVEDFQTDDRHCGSCGNACETFSGIGACTNGECPPTLSDCVVSDTVTNCDAVCTAQGRTCVAQGCGPTNRSWVQFADEIACDIFSQEGSGTEACADDLSAVVVQPYLRCCCTP